MGLCHANAPELVLEGNLLRNAGCMRAEDTYRRAIKRAQEIYRRAIGIDPHCSDAWAELGCCLLDDHQFSEAAGCFRKVLDISKPVAPTPDCGAEANDAHQQAVQLLLEITTTRPGWANGHLILGSTYGQLGDYSLARAHLDAALRLDGSLEAAVQSMFARMYYNEGRWSEALAAADRSLEADSDNALTHFVRSSACSALGRTAESLESTRRALEISPSPTYQSHLLFTMNFLAETTPESIYAEACRWNALHAAPLIGRSRPHANAPDAGRRIKIGYVSPDLYSHSLMKFIPPVFERHDRSRFEVFVYAMGAKSDSRTEELRRSIENWVPMARAASLECAERVRADGIDILVDLAGHTMGPAYLAFAYKPAPVQVSWLGVLSTTGMSTIDYFLGDAHMPCPGTEHLFSETVHRLPVTCCYRPGGDVPVAPTPCLERGYITFGSFNNPQKITRDVVKLWSAILHLVPASRLLLKYRSMETEAMRDGFYRWFAEDGISRERIAFAGASAANEYLMAYGDIDIALDPFPYNGGSTTLDALWMGVPLVTLAGRLAVQRAGTSALSAMGLSDFVAHTTEQYLKIAQYLAAVVPKMPDLRFEVRQALASSPLMDEIGFVRSLESAYRDMWQTWCRSRS